MAINPSTFLSQYALYKKMTQAAILIQSKFRSYYEQKRFQQSRRAAVLIQQCYRSYREGARSGPALQHRIKGSFLTKEAGSGCPQDHALPPPLPSQDEGDEAGAGPGLSAEEGADQLTPRYCWITDRQRQRKSRRACAIPCAAYEPG
ncbi:unnamed protein product [Ranitomeya imitator]|uniref:Calmodulin-binding transcription activator 2 n=1 Tax=Ranitomeya imitator TaxID=111125 RepID=A0ABN9MB87_9NEOB|nr:unnamed protein product [Ranitomeya imitator]